MFRHIVVVTLAGLVTPACTEPVAMTPDAPSAMDTTSERHKADAGSESGPEPAQSRLHPKTGDVGRTAKDAATPQEPEQDSGEPELSESLQSCIQDGTDAGAERTDLELAVRLDCVETTRCNTDATIGVCIDNGLHALMMAPQSHRARFYRVIAKCCGLHACEYVRCTSSVP